MLHGWGKDGVAREILIIGKFDYFLQWVPSAEVDQEEQAGAGPQHLLRHSEIQPGRKLKKIMACSCLL